MALLTDQFYDELRSRPSKVAPVQPVVPEDNSVVGILNQAESETMPNVRLQGEITPEEQVKRFGGVVGSKEYYERKASEKPISVQGAFGLGIPKLKLSSTFTKQLASTVGINLPDDETWDKMSRLDQITHVTGAAGYASARMLAQLPKEIVKAPVRIALTTAAPWVSMIKGKTGSLEELASDKPVELPWLGSVPNFFQTFKEAKDSGMGNLGAAVFTTGLAAGDVTIAAPLAEGLASVTRPRMKLAPGETIKNTGPIQGAIVEAEGKPKFIAKPKDSVNEYYSLPKSVVSSYGGRTNDTFLKLTPVAEGEVKLSFVRVREGVIPKTVDYIKGKMGIGEKTYQGDFGKEITLESRIIPISKDYEGAMNFGKTKVDIPMDLVESASEMWEQIRNAEAGYRDFRTLPGGETENFAVHSSFPKWVPQELRSRKLFDSFTEKEKLSDLTPKEKKLFYAFQNELAERTGRQTTDTFFDESILGDKMFVEFKKIFKDPVDVPASPLKGFENKPVTESQLNTLGRIAEANKLSPFLRDTVVKAVSGKQALGELTQAEFAKAAQTLNAMKGQYIPETPGVNWVSSHLSPQRHWMRTYEESSGIPVYSEVYVPMENAVKTRNVFRDSFRNRAREVYGKYAGVTYGEERRLISDYLKGNTGAIAENATIDAATKADLVKIADQVRGLYNEAGPLLDVPPEIFLNNYQPRVQNIGGVYQLYKEGAVIPKELEFFAKFKKTGGLQGVQIDDSLALFDIYINAGSNAKFLNPAVSNAAKLSETLPSTLQNSVKSYVFEKMGYAGRAEQFIDSFVPALNKKLGLNLPPDAARTYTNYILSTMYSGYLSQPATWFRQSFQYPLFGYSRLGPKFSVQAMRQGLTREGIAETRANGFLVDLGVPYGEELTKELTPVGKIGQAYKAGTQALISPNSVADNSMRSIVYHQSKMIFDDALAKYNSGKINWAQFEKEADFKSMSPIDQNIVRQNLVKGDINAARNHYIRDIVDDTNFPYRRGASARVTYGLAGKLSTSLLQWPIEAANVMTRWVKGGQWDKVIRFAGASVAIERTMKETFGFDFARTLDPRSTFSSFYSPFVRGGIEVLNGISNLMQNNKEEFNKNKDAVVKTLSAGLPEGLEVKNIANFWRSYKRGANEDGTFSVLNKQGEVSYNTDFYGLFWGVLMGFPINEKVESSQIQKDIANDKFVRSQMKQKALELMQQEKFDEAGKILGEYGIEVTAQDLDDYYIPLNERNFKTLTPMLKAKYAPRIYQ